MSRCTEPRSRPRGLRGHPRERRSERRRPGAKRRARGGFAVFLVLSVVLAASLMITVGLDRRADDLDFQPRALCRVAARSAAESGLARARAEVEAGRTARIQGTLASGPRKAEVTYSAELTRTAAGVTVVAEGRCHLEGSHPIDLRLTEDLTRDAGAWHVTRFAESPSPSAP